ncbi:MAG: hypothetical protein ACFFFK_05530 [Candidatus Thorarchaeota archaeon]
MMKIDDIEITPIAAESLGTRSLCTRVVTHDVAILFDPSAALAKRYNLEPHPDEYLALRNALESIERAALETKVLSVSHYHYDHVRPGFENQVYNLSMKNERSRMFSGKVVLIKDNRDQINPSQRRRGFYFEKDVTKVVEKIEWADNRVFHFKETRVIYSPPLPHGPPKSPLGFVLATLVEHAGVRFMFAPDVQGPIVQDTLQYILQMAPDLLIIGGPPIYLSRFNDSERALAQNSLIVLASAIPTLVVDHHLLRSINWKEWMDPVFASAEKSGNRVLTMAELAGRKNTTLEAQRESNYENNPPSEEFMKWAQASDEFKLKHPAPLSE